MEMILRGEGRGRRETDIRVLVEVKVVERRGLKEGRLLLVRGKGGKGEIGIVKLLGDEVLLAGGLV
jgi:hypothetical protein